MTTLHSISRNLRPAFLFFAASGIPAWGFAEEPAADPQAEPRSSALAAPPEEDLREKAMAHYTNGRELLEQQNFQDAFPQLRIAHQLAVEAESPNAWKILGSLGYCALQLERDGEALEFYREYLERGGDAIAAEERESIHRELALIEGNLVTVQVSMGEEKFRVIVSRAGSMVPPQAYDSATGSLKLGLRAGTHVFAVEKGDRTLAEKRTTVKPGESRVLAFGEPEAEKANVPPPSSAPLIQPMPEPQVEDESSGTRPLRVASFVAGGVGVAGLISGVILAAKAGAERDDAYDEVTGDPSLCRGTVCSVAAEERFSSADSLATTSSVFLIGGGALFATGVGLFLYDLRSKNSESAFRIVPSFGKKSGALHLLGQF